MADPLDLHRRITSLPADKQLHVAADMVATGRLPLLRVVESLLPLIQTNIKLKIRAAQAQEKKEGDRGDQP